MAKKKRIIECVFSKTGAPLFTANQKGSLDLFVNVGGKTEEGYEVLKEVELKGTKKGLLALASLIVGLAEINDKDVHIHLDEANEGFYSQDRFVLSISRK